MKTRTIILILFVVAVFTSSSATIINIPDDYSTIQEGIDASSDGDTVLVQPGEYHGNINFNGHNIVLGSLFLTTGDIGYIEQTVIEGEYNDPIITFENEENSNTIITGFTIQNGWALLGGGIYCVDSSPKIIYNVICNNTSSSSDYSAGGGIYCDQANPVISKNIIKSNVAQGSMLTWALGGGIYISNSTTIITHNILNYNSAWAGSVAQGEGGGIFCYNSEIFLGANVIISNVAGDIGGGIRTINSTIAIINNIIRGNLAESDSQIAGGPYPIEYNNIQDGYPGEGNIDADPLFRDPENADFHLMAIECGDSVDSPCIDAGHPDILDSLLGCAWGLGTILSDMGAYGGGDSAGVRVDDSIKQLPKRFTLSQNYPNPFNTSTIIRYNLPEPSAVTINIYDILGRKVQTLIDKYQSAGHHQVIWQADEFSSGIYFYKLTAGDFENTKKMVLLK